MRPEWPSRGRRHRSAGANRYAAAELPRGSASWRAAGWCALDFELTGLDLRRDEIISFGAIPIDAGLVRLGGSVAGFARPERAIGEASVRVHSIRDVDLATAPPLRDGIDRLLALLSGRGLVVHTAAVERTLLRRALRDQGLRLRGPIVDTELLGRLWLHRRDGRLRPRLGLSELARSLGLPVERAHDALGDALTTAQVFIALATHLDSEQPETVRSLARADRRLEQVRMFHAG